jgi:DNA polymerase-1
LWLTGRGIDIMSRAYMDTMLVDHALNENAEHDLESVAVRYTDMGRYDWQLRKWLSDNGVGDKQLRRVGYRDIPDDLLHPYSCCDADATYRVAAVLDRLLSLPANEMVARCYRDIIHPCMTPLHEMELNGVLADWGRLVMLVRKYEQKKLELVEKLRDDVGDPDFNFRSVPQVQKLLFGKRDEGGLGLTPLKTTGKPAKMWEDLLLEDDPSAVSRASPSTDAESLEYLASETPIASKLRDVKIIDQVTKNFLRSPEVDFDTGVEVFHDGLVGQIDADGRVRTTFSQMSETGRQKSSDPNMQNLPSRQNDELDRIMGPDVPHIRSCFVSPEKTVMIEADYKSAELFTLGYLANCPALVRDCASDIHARGAVTRMGAPKWFGFDEYAKPPDDWKTKYKHLRIASKTISFGIPYQRGAKAIAREIVKATHGQLMCDLIKAQRMVDGFYAQYPEVAAYVEMCKNSVLRGSLFNPYGRTRRFAVSDSLDQGTIAAMQREAVNFPIQSTVADTLNQAMYNLWYFRKLYPGLAEYRIILAVHDALFLEVPVSSVRVVVEKALPLSMNYGATVPSWKPTSDYVATQPFNLDIDIEVMTRWGEKADKSELIAMGLDSDIADRYAA